MGQIKNIKLHIVTDIKTFHKLVVSNNNSSQDDEGNHEFWQTPQQVAHAVCTMWTFVVPHTEEGVCFVRVPQCTNPKFQLGLQGQEKKDDWYRPHATHEESSPSKSP